jgi:hypothetical protein
MSGKHGSATASSGPNPALTPAQQKWVEKFLDKKLSEFAATHGIASDPSEELANRIPQCVDGFLGTWVEAMSHAVQSVPPPHVDNDLGSFNVFVVLLGNLVWASTCFIAPEFAAVIKIMSVLGAATGSGIFIPPDTGQPPVPTAEIYAQLERARDGMKKVARSEASTFAADIIKAGATKVDDQDKLIWEKLFGSLEFDSMRALSAKAIPIVQSAFDQCTAQWLVWKAQIKQELISEIGTEMKGETPVIGGIPNFREVLPKVLKNHPFAPTIKMNLDNR